MLRGAMVTAMLALSSVAGSWFVSSTAWGQNRAALDQARRKLVDDVIKPSGITNPRVLQSMSNTHRHEFVAKNLWEKAYFDISLPIGAQQTISSPFIVAFMTQSLDPQPTDVVLEIGTGSGYQAAILAPLVKEVYSIEIVPELGVKAAKVLERLRYKNVVTKVGDGFLGWPEHAPFDKIIVTCSPEKVPVPLVEQLREGGLIVVPVGERYQQTLYLMRKKNGKLEQEALLPTLFVPMTGEAEKQRQVQPDPLNPKCVNGGFEEPPEKENYVPGWFYHRLVTWETDAKAPEGRHCVTFRNQEPGQSAHLLQGFPIDGRKIAELDVTAWAKSTGARPSRNFDDVPCLAVTFFDEQRKDIGTTSSEPILGTSDWHQKSKRVRVPPQAREGILRIGLFGSVGEASFDGVRLKPMPR